ncbi:MAG: 2-dehydropantoate 2-reductase [Chloroflexota bacterium]|nr:2-dehydropantoate 2-reductase [Chloroflexota bacterium]
MRYIVYGAGAVGGVIAARLQQHGQGVVAIARGAHLDAMRARGLMLETPDETLTLPIAAAGHPSEIDFRDGDVALLTMKTQHTERALDDLRAAAGDDVPVVCAQNGVENERLALRRFARVYGMLVVLPATYLEPGIVQIHAGANGILDCGRYPAGDDALAAEIAAGLEAAGFSAHPVADIMRWKYGKLLSNLGNALQAAIGLGVFSFDAARDAGVGDVLARLRDEAVACYRAAGIAWASDEEMDARRQDALRLRPVGGKPRGGGSTWQSIARGAGSVETDFLNGEIVLLGRIHGIPTPANAALQRVAQRLVRERLGPGSIAPDDLRREIAAEAASA